MKKSNSVKGDGGSNSKPQAMWSVVGSDFTPGMEMNVKIHELLGEEAGTFGGMLRCRKPDSETWTEGTDWCNTAALIPDISDLFGPDTPILEVVPARSEPANVDFDSWVATFILAGSVAVTAPFPSPSNAISCALFYALKHKSALT